MNLVEFKEQTVVFAKDQSEYKPLPAWRRKNDQTGEIVCCWKLSIGERIAVLFSGLIWHSILTFNQPLQPQLLSVEKPSFDEMDNLNTPQTEGAE
jgi:hypothetical protein